MFQRKGGRRRNRLERHDYSKAGYYFVTICTKGLIECFGKITQDEMRLSETGRIADWYWREITLHYVNVEIDEYVIMPNHIHGIIVINNIAGTEQCSVRTEMIQKYGLLSKVIKSFKEIVTKTARRKYNNYDFQWQRSFYDRIIRNERSLNKIRQYILDNPLKWGIRS